ncbi:hypothetical protein VPNG_03953 [Cytospora leucostoma]|uniref:Uncharacterized protein n=1 Tax=Cytospora leucostoma TaxID=1230097 RepID=A0A423XEB6_9PEZI|nr:hypothetical protein VPNG_03953 [Cytospora leucostoma]
MTTAAAPNPGHDLYDPDAVVPQNSPLLVPKKVQPSQGDAVLIGIMDNGRHPDIAAQAGHQALPSDSEEEDDSPDTESSDDETEVVMTMSGKLRARSLGQNPESVIGKGNVSPGSPSDLQTLAGGALAALRLGESKASSDECRTVNIAEDTGTAVLRPSESSRLPPTIPIPEKVMRTDDRPQPLAPPSYASPDYYSPRAGSFASPTGSLVDNGALPPIQSASPRSESNGGMSLPSIRDQLGLDALSPGSYQHSPPAMSPGSVMPRLPSISQTSPPMSPTREPYPRGPRSPHVILPQNPYYSFPPNGLTNRPSVDYSHSTPSTDQSGSTPATSTHSVADRMSIDGVAFSNPQEIGQYICNHGHTIAQ